MLSSRHSLCGDAPSRDPGALARVCFFKSQVLGGSWQCMDDVSLNCEETAVCNVELCENIVQRSTQASFKRLTIANGNR